MALKKSLYEVENEITADELDLWKEFYNESPFGEERRELQNALLCSTTANSMGNKTSMKDFMLFQKEEKKDWGAELAAAFLSM